MNLVEYPDRELAAIDVADVLASDLKTALITHDRVSFAVPGGGTPGPIFSVLCAADLDWARVCVLPTDERFVPADHPRSNALLIRERLLQDRAAAAQFLSLTGDATTPEDAAAKQGARIARHLPISVTMLGMGTDMHTASLFPGAPGLAEGLATDAPPLLVTQPASQPEARLSLSAPVLNGAISKHLVIFGADKRAALEQAIHSAPEAAPIRAVLGGATVHYAD